ncbi:hypothetical protein [Nocardia xishanensis]|uniref:hypothetical protein n=1 Tax=Nocardia xishanensis TaxID=238964 RepID=UPI00083157B0|nr:hypothetical protein [Nocardia xishanensis]
MRTTTIPVSRLRAGHRITRSGLAVEGRVVADVTEAADDHGCWVQVTFADGSTWDLDGWDAPVTVVA